MKYLMFNPFSTGSRVYMAPASVPAEDDAVGGGAENDPEGDPEGDSEDTEDTEDDSEDDSEDAEDDSEDDSEDTEDDSKDNPEDGDMGKRAKKRINKLIAERKEATAKVAKLEQQLEEAKKLSGDDGKALLKAAEKSGILPGLMTKAEAEAFTDLDEYPRVIERLEDWLDENGDGDIYETSGGKELTYGQVKKRVRKLKEEYADLKDEYGSRRKELQKKVREIYELGVEAQKAGWKPDGSKKTDKKKKLKTKPDGKSSARPTRESFGGADDFDVDNGDDFEAYVMRSRKRRK